MTTNPYKILVRPIITEDSEDLAAMNEPQYLFEVVRTANKIEIARAVEAAFGVQVKAVNTIRRKGKMKRVRRALGKKADSKKAFVTLRQGQSIKLY